MPHAETQRGTERNAEPLCGSASLCEPAFNMANLDPIVPSAELRSLLGQADIYLIDQLLRGRFDARRRMLDAGCGDGRNLVYFLQRGFACFGIDREPAAVEHVRR